MTTVMNLMHSITLVLASCVVAIVNFGKALNPVTAPRRIASFAVSVYGRVSAFVVKNQLRPLEWLMVRFVVFILRNRNKLQDNVSAKLVMYFVRGIHVLYRVKHRLDKYDDLRLRLGEIVCYLQRDITERRNSIRIHLMLPWPDGGVRNKRWGHRSITVSHTIHLQGDYQCVHAEIEKKNQYWSNHPDKDTQWKKF